MINYIINSYTKEKKGTHEKLDVGKELEGKTYYLGRTFCFVLGKSNNSVDLKKKKVQKRNSKGETESGMASVSRIAL